MLSIEVAKMGQHCSPTNSIRHKLNAVYVVLAAV